MRSYIILFIFSAAWLLSWTIAWVEWQSLVNPEGFSWKISVSFQAAVPAASSILVMGIQKEKVNSVAHQVQEHL